MNPELKKFLKEIYVDLIPFNKLVGMNVDFSGSHDVCITVETKPELIGNFAMGILHGGVISSTLDVAGGVISCLGAIEKMDNPTLEEVGERMRTVGTIDLRVDYLRPGRGERFQATGAIMRTGRKVAVTRMEFRNQEDLLIAVGTGTYLVG